MNKEIVDCIKAEKEKEALLRKEKEEKIQKIKDFFIDLPEGEYNLRLVYTVIVKKLIDNPTFLNKIGWSQRELYTDEEKEEYKEKWMADLHCHTIEIHRIPNDLYIRKSAYNDIYVWGRSREMDNWSDDIIQVFSEHLDWFEKEIGRQYCKKP